MNQSNYSAASQAPPAKKSSPVPGLVILLVACGGLFSCCGIGAIKLRSMSNEVKTFGELNQVCDGKGVAAAGQYQEGKSNHWYGAEAYDDKWVGWTNNPFEAETNKSKDIADTSVVFCSKPSNLTIAKCKYSGGITVTKLQPQLEVRAIEAKTGRLLQKEVIAGTAPDAACAASISDYKVTKLRISVQSSNRTEEGDPPPAEEVRERFSAFFK